MRDRPLHIVLTHVYAWPEVRRGAERYVHELAAALTRAGHHVEVLTTAPRSGRSTVLGVPVHAFRRRRWLPARYAEQAAEVAFGLQCLLRLAFRRCDVWHAVSTGDGAAAGLLRRLRPGLTTVYTEAGLPWREAYRSQRADHRLYESLMRNAGHVVCLSQPATDAARRDYGRTARTVPAGVDLSAFPAGTERHPRPVLLFPASLSEPRKHVSWVLEAAALLTQRGTPVELWLVGPGRLPEDLSDLARQGLSAVTRHETVDAAALPDLYRRAWVTVLPSDGEVFGLVVLESLASGTPAVVLDDGLGPAQLVAEGTGVRCRPGGAGVAAACAEALELAARPETRQACRDVAERYDWDRVVVPALLPLYRSDRNERMPA